MSQETMYPPQANSPGTELAQAITADAVELTVQDGDVLLEAPNTVTIGSDETAETILYAKKEGNVLSEITRAWDGTAAKAWTTGSKVARYLNAQDVSALQGNIKDLDSRVGDLTELQTTAKDNTVAAINEVFQSVGNGKTLIADAITDKGILTSATDTFGQMAENIEGISTEISGEKLEEFLLASDVKKGDAVGIRTVFTKIADPVVMPEVATYGVALSEDGNYLAISTNIAPFLLLYKREGDTFVKLPNPSVLPTSLSHYVKFGGDYLYISGAVSGGTNITVYKRNGDTFTKLAHPDLSLNGGINDFDVSPDGQYLAVGTTQASNLVVWKRTGDTFTRIVSPFINSTTNVVEIPSSVIMARFSPDSSKMVISFATTPFAYAYKISSSGVFVKSTFPAQNIHFRQNACLYTPDGTYFIAEYSMASYPKAVFNIEGDTFKVVSTFGDETARHQPVFTPDSKLYIGSQPSNPLAVFKNVNGNFVKRKVLLPNDFKPYRTSLYDGILVGVTTVAPFFAAYKMSQQAFKIENTYQDMIESDKIGYVKEDGQAGETKQIAIVWED